MIRYVYNMNDLDTLLRVEEATPECGEDFCDRCGDCLDCYGSDPCANGGEHFWVEYEVDDD